MRKLLNYSSNDTIATGLSRPKMTALLFDKIWIPSDLRHSEYGEKLGYDKIPLKLCVIEEIEESIRRETYLSDAFFRRKSSKSRQKGFDELQIAPYFGQNRPFCTVEEDVLQLNFLFSRSRNLGLKQVVNSFKRIYGIEIVPIYLEYTDFEKSLLDHDEERAVLQLQRSRENSKINSMFEFGSFSISDISEIENRITRSAYEICMTNIPLIVEDRLDWKQVLEMREDRSSIKKIHRFRTWVNLDLSKKSKSEIIDTLESCMEDYKYALKKHGIITVLGGMATILSASSTVVEALSNDFTSQLSAGLAISSGLITYTATQIGSYFDKKRNPIALIYELERDYLSPTERKNKTQLKIN